MQNSVIEIYNGQIAKMRRGGLTLDEISEKTGVTGERIRQILNEYYPDDIYPQCVNFKVMAKLLGHSEYVIRKIIKRVGFVPTYPSNRLYKYSISDVKRLQEILKEVRVCKICEATLPKGKAKFCSNECYRVFHLHRYKNATIEQQQRHKMAVKKWKETHPEIAKEMQGKAMKKYCDKKTVKATQPYYVIARRCQLPIGTVLQAIDSNYSDRVLIMKDGHIVPFGCVKRISNEKNDE